LLDFRVHRIPMGGTDWISVADRFREPTPLLGRVIERVAGEVSCMAVMQDAATVDPVDRLLFTGQADLPSALDANDNENPATALSIRLQLQRLFKVVLQREVAVDSADLDDAYGMLVDAERTGRTLIDVGTAVPALPARCRATQSLAIPAVPYPTADGSKVRLTADPEYTLRAWVAVVSYLISDASFFLE
jgi:hypothetical protein